jgi:hypothetical protein
MDSPACKFDPNHTRSNTLEKRDIIKRTSLLCHQRNTLQEKMNKSAGMIGYSVGLGSYLR